MTGAFTGEFLAGGNTIQEEREPTIKPPILLQTAVAGFLNGAFIILQ